MEHYQYALKHLPAELQWTAHLGLATGWQLQRHFEQSLPEFNRALESCGEEERWLVLLGLASCLQEMGKYDQAELRNEEALRHIPVQSAWMAHFQMAGALEAQHRLDAAVEHFRESLALAPARRAAEVMFALAGCLTEQGQLVEAIRLQRRALSQSPAASGQRVKLSHMLAANGQSELAIAELASQLAGKLTRSELAQVHFLLGKNQATLNQWDAALREYRLAVKFDPESADAWLGQAIVLLELNDSTGGHCRASPNPADSNGRHECTPGVGDGAGRTGGYCRCDSVAASCRAPGARRRPIARRACQRAL